jgi:OmpW family
VVRRVKIALSSSLLLALTICHSNAFAVNKKKSKAQPRTTMIGFRSGRDYLFNTTPSLHSKSAKMREAISNGVVFRKNIIPHIKAEAQFNMDKPAVFPGFTNNLNKNKFSLPLTIQYHPFCEKAKLSPYCGIGVQYNANPDAIPQSTEGTNQQVNGTKYINLVFTSGVTYEVNTKINITENIHFIPEASHPVFGIDLGIGCKLP